MAEATEGSAVAVGFSDSELQKNVHHGDAETLRENKIKVKPESAEVAEDAEVRLSQRGLRIQSAKRMFTTEARRHGENKGKARHALTEVAEDTEARLVSAALQGFQFLEGSRPILA